MELRINHIRTNRPRPVVHYAKVRLVRGKLVYHIYAFGTFVYLKVRSHGAAAVTAFLPQLHESVHTVRQITIQTISLPLLQP